MVRYVLKRLVLAAVVLAGVVFVTFVIARAIPGDPAAIYAGPHASSADIAHVRHQLGLDRPFVTQVSDYMGGVFVGNWGTSLRTHSGVFGDIGVALPPSIELVAAGLVLAILFGLPLGMIAARWKGRWPDFLARLVSVTAASMPVFWLALLLQRLFYQQLKLLPLAGEYDPNLYYTHPLRTYTRMPVVDALVSGNWPVFGSSAEHLILPALAVAAYPIGLISRLVRASLLDTLGEEHIRMVRGVGFGERAIFTRFALKPALNPIVQVVALVSAYLLANTFLVEAIFDWPGLGSYAANSIEALDTPAIVGVTLVVACVYVLLNLIVDLVQAVIDPRIRLE